LLNLFFFHLGKLRSKVLATSRKGCRIAHSMNFSWPKSRYVRLLEEDRLQHLARIESLEIKCERQQRALLLASGSPAAHEYIRRAEPPRPMPTSAQSEPASWEDYSEKWEAHLRHTDLKAPEASCPFCEPVEVKA